MRFSKFAYVLALGLACFVMPVLLNTAGLYRLDIALAKQGGNGQGNGSGNGNGNGNGKDSDGSSKGTSGKSSSPSTRSQAVGKRNASAPVEASKAAPKLVKATSRASPPALKMKAVTDETDVGVKREAFEKSAIPSVVTAYESLQAEPANSALEETYNRVVTDAVLTGEQIAAVESAYAEWQGAVRSARTAASASNDAETTFNAAKN